MTNVRRRCGALAGLAVATTLAATPAQAAAGWNYTYSAVMGSESYSIYNGSSLRARSVTQQDDSRYDEVIYLLDLKADGLGSRVTWSAGGKSGTCVNEKGNGSKVPCDMSAAEGSWVSYQFCVKQGSTPVACAPRDGFTA